MRTFRALMLPVFSHHARGNWFEKVENTVQCIQHECWPIHEAHNFVNCDTTPYVYAECLSTCASKFDFSPEESREFLDEPYEKLCSVDTNQHLLYSQPPYSCAHTDCAKWLRLTKVGGALKEEKLSTTSAEISRQSSQTEEPSSTTAPPAKLQGGNYLEALRHFQQCINSECVPILAGDNSFDCQESPYAYATCAGSCYGKADFPSDVDGSFWQDLENVCSIDNVFRHAPFFCITEASEVDCAKIGQLAREEAEHGLSGKTGAFFTGASSPKTHVFSPFVLTIGASIYFS